MLLFTIKKAFFDMWDNLFTLVFLNLGFIFLSVGLSAGLQSLYAIGLPMWLFLPGIGLILFLCSLYLGAASMLMRDIADYRYPELKNFSKYLTQNSKAALVLTLILVFQILIVGLAIPWYIRQGGFIGLAATAVLFWVCVFWWFAAQYYFPVRSRLVADKVKPLLLKSFALFFDNIGFTLAVALGTCVLTGISFFLAFLFPGIGTILLWHQVAVKLRLYKYDYAESHPDATKKYPPWNTLLQEDSRLVGKHTLKGMFFPWKG